MLKKLFVGIAAVIVVILIIASTKPNDFKIERSATINAPADVVFAQVNDLHRWQIWSPWSKKDPAAKVAYAGPDAGLGAGFSWDGNSEVGAGTMTIVESVPASAVRFKLDFTRPFAATNAAEFTFKPEGNQTTVTWSMSGKNNFVGKLMSVFINCDKMVGGEFEKGLGDLKALAEKPAQK